MQTVNSYNTSLFFSNQNSYDISDVQVLKITDTDSTEFDYYYMYGTTKTYEFYAYRSKNLSDWQPVTQMTGGKAAFTPGKENYCTDYLWAPEVIYDEKTDKYYMFYSGRNKSKTAVNGIEPLEIGLAVANEPYGPFTAYTDDIHDSSTPLFDGDKINESLGENDKTDIFTCIDPHPFVAQDGTKYLYFSRSNDPGAGYKQAIYGIKMDDWAKPDYKTLTRLTRNGYLTVDGTEIANYENDGPANEGPFMYEQRNSDGTYKYYLTLSIGDYQNKSYSVIQAVSDSPLGKFRKLTEAEGGILLSSNHSEWDNISGPGHHSFIEVGDELVVAYHKHTNPSTGGVDRTFAFDRVCITENINGESVLYVNGPTTSVQPGFEEFSNFKNIAPEAKVSISNGINAFALTDGLLSLYNNIDYIKEYESAGNATILLEFDNFREITALMIYNSKSFDRAFSKINHIEFQCIEDGIKTPVVNYIDDLQFDWKAYKTEIGNVMRPGGSATAAFTPMMIKSIKIELESISNQDIIALSEIVVLGK